MVQRAINDGLLQYQKTLLVWTASALGVSGREMLSRTKGSTLLTRAGSPEEMHKKAAIKAKLQIVKNALIEVLAEARQGISLAQLPLYLKRKLPFMLNLNELGFAKLKDLVLSMSDQIKLELRSHNHPFAYLIHSGHPAHAKGNSDDLG